MNDDGPSSVAADALPRFPWALRRSSGAGSSSRPQGSASEVDGEIRTKARGQISRRLHFLQDLIRNVDILIYCQLSIVYYLDCSLLRFFIRAIPHWLLFTPKPVFFPRQTHNRPYVSTIALTNSFCALLHILLSRPEAGQASRGYLHGGLLIDFVGELGPVSKWKLLLLDIFVVVLQVLILGATLEKRELRSAMSRPVNIGSTENRDTLSRQDLDAEEQGIRRSQDGLLSSPRLGGVGGEEDIDEVFEASEPKHEHYLDAFYGGQYVIFNLHVAEMIRRAWIRRYDTAPPASTTAAAA